MFVRTLQLTNFKSYPGAEISFDSPITGLAGLNGSGKTNLLDALHFLCTGKSYFNPSDRQSIRFDANFFRLEGRLVEGNDAHRIVCIQELGKRKKIEVDEVPVGKLSEFIGRFTVVVIAPDDVGMINSGSEERRRFLDMSVSFCDREYLEALTQYKKIIQLRNSLLKESARKGHLDKDLLAGYDRLLPGPAHLIHEKRKTFIKGFLGYFNRYYQILSETREQVSLQYESRLETKRMDDLLLEVRAKDELLQRSTEGVHRDDLIFRIEGRELKSFASQGQKKSFLIALKLAQFEYLKVQTKRKPILLLDDIFDRLDENRAAHLVSLVAGEPFGQVIVSDTSAARLRKIFGAVVPSFDIFEVKEGEIRSGNGSESE